MVFLLNFTDILGQILEKWFLVLFFSPSTFLIYRIKIGDVFNPFWTCLLKGRNKNGDI